MRGRLLLLALIVCFGDGPVIAQTRRTAPPAPVIRNPAGERGLVDLEKQILQAIRERKTDTLEALLADDFIYISPRNPDLRKQQFLNRVKSSPLEIEWLGAEDMKIHIYGDVAVVTGIQNAKVRSSQAGTYSGERVFTDVFRKTQGQWQLVLAFVPADFSSTPDQ